jgi:predicted RNase H-like nuclease
MAVLLGADGCGRDWLVVRHDTATAHTSAFLSTTQDIAHLDFDVLAIDIPIGLPEAGRRPADARARTLVGPRRSSVFPSPIRPSLYATTREEACQITQAADGRRVGVQSFAILPKIRAVIELLQANPQLASRVFEVHPEVSFAAWAGHPLLHNKKRAAGKQERQQFIAGEFGPTMFTALREALPAGVAADDLADAFAALWSARRIHERAALRLPDEAVVDATGRPMEIWY